MLEALKIDGVGVEGWGVYIGFEVSNFLLFFCLIYFGIGKMGFITIGENFEVGEVSRLMMGAEVSLLPTSSLPITKDERYLIK